MRLPYLDEVVGDDQAFHGNASATIFTQADDRTGIVYLPNLGGGEITYEEIDWLGLGPEEE